MTTLDIRTDAALETFASVRSLTDRLSSRLTPEDQVPQSMTEASPAKWHRAHTTWFFEEFVLGADPAYEPVDPAFRYLFNSYYESVGARHPRPSRGMVTRPGVGEVTRFREVVDARVRAALEDGRLGERELELLELGCNHEQQHQELLLFDIKHLFSGNGIDPVYVERPADDLEARAGESTWVEVPGGIHHIGHDGLGFGYDNEGPRHRVFIEDTAIASRQVTNAEWREFIDDGGYRDPGLWLSDGWGAVQENGWEAPGYWQREADGSDGSDGLWTTFTMSGRRRVVDAEPVCHVSFFEAEAFARWCGARLPTEFEWEVFGGADPDTGGGLLDPDRVHPSPAADCTFGNVWEWTASAYLPYPGFTPVGGAVGEYNGKFMNDQHVLRGACAATPAGHARTTYRNFYPASARWTFSGLRLARA